MGKEEYRFKFSALVSNSWFYKLKDLRSRGSKISKECRAEATQNSMEKSQIPRTEPKQSIQPSLYATNRPSYYIPTGERAEKLLLTLNTDKVIDTTVPVDKGRIPERKNRKKLTSNSNNLINSSVSPVFTCRKQSSSVPTSLPTTAHRLHSIEEDLEDDIPASSLIPPLPPILTKPRPFAGRKQSSPKNGRSPPNYQQIKVRIKSPKLAKRMPQKRKGLGKSFVVVKSSSNPEKDFRESMEEMIVENNLCSLKELEELLACYLALNSTEYHDLIVKVFKQIWFDLPEFVLQS